MILLLPLNVISPPSVEIGKMGCSHDESTIALTYPNLTGAAGSEDWDSLGDYLFPVTSMMRLVEAVSVDLTVSRKELYL